MADNITLNAGSGGVDLATDEITSVHYQKILVGFGADGAWSRVTSTATNPFPVALSDTDNAVLDVIAAGFAAEGTALGSGVLLQGDDGTDRTNVLVDTDGHLQIDVLSCASHAVTNAGTFAVQVDGDALTALQLLDDAVYADDADWTDSTSKHLLVGGLYQSSPQTITDGDVGPIQVTANGYPIVSVNGTVTVGAHAVTNAGTFVVQEDGAALTALQVMDDWDESDRCKVNPIAGQAGIAAGAGAVGVTVPRVTLASDDPAVVDLAAIEVLLGTIDADTGAIKTAVELIDTVGGGTEAAAQRVTIANDSTGLLSVDDNGSSLTVDTTGTSGLEVVQDTAADLNVTEASAAAIKTAVEIIDDWDDGSDHCEVVGAAAEDAAVAGAPVLAAGRYDSSERTTDNGDATTLAASPQGWMMVGNQSSYLFDGVTRCQVKRVSGLAASGTTAMVAAVAGKKIRILALALFATSATATNVYVATTTDTDVLGNSGNPIPLAVDADGDNIPGFVLPYNQGGWTETSTANEALNLVLSAAQDVIYALTYIEVA